LESCIVHFLLAAHVAVHGTGETREAPKALMECQAVAPWDSWRQDFRTADVGI